VIKFLLESFGKILQVTRSLMVVEDVFQKMGI